MKIVSQMAGWHYLVWLILVTLSLPLAAGLDISSVTIVTTNNSATLSWSTDVASVSNLTWDTQPLSYQGNHSIVFDLIDSTTHTKTIHGLTENTTYFYLIVERSGKELATKTGSFLTEPSTTALPPTIPTPTPLVEPFNFNDYLFYLLVGVIAICIALLIVLIWFHKKSVEYYRAILRTIKAVCREDYGVEKPSARSLEPGHLESDSGYLHLAKARASGLLETTPKWKGIDRSGLSEKIIKILAEEIEKIEQSEKARYEGATEFREYSPSLGLKKIVERIEEEVAHKIKEAGEREPREIEKDVMDKLKRAEMVYSDVRKTVEDNYMQYHPDIPRHFLTLAREEIEVARQMLAEGDYKGALIKVESVLSLLSYIAKLYDVFEHRMLLETLKKRA